MSMSEARNHAWIAEITNSPPAGWVGSQASQLQKTDTEPGPYSTSLDPAASFVSTPPSEPPTRGDHTMSLRTDMSRTTRAQDLSGQAWRETVLSEPSTSRYSPDSNGISRAQSAAPELGEGSANDIVEFSQDMEVKWKISQDDNDQTSSPLNAQIDGPTTPSPGELTPKVSLAGMNPKRKAPDAVAQSSGGVSDNDSAPAPKRRTVSQGVARQVASRSTIHKSMIQTAGVRASTRNRAAAAPSPASAPPRRAANRVRGPELSYLEDDQDEPTTPGTKSPPNARPARKAAQNKTTRSR